MNTIKTRKLATRTLIQIENDWDGWEPAKRGETWLDINDIIGFNDYWVNPTNWSPKGPEHRCYLTVNHTIGCGLNGVTTSLGVKPEWYEQFIKQFVGDPE